MLGRGQRSMLAETSVEALLCAGFNIPSDSLAATCAMQAGLGGGHWLRADLVQLRLEGAQAVLLPPDAPDAEEAAALCAALNAALGDRGLRFHAPQPQHWYLALSEPPGIETLPLSRVLGADAMACLPHGPQAARWHALLNEIQMVLYTHAVNDRRAAQGRPLLNSLWLWGGGAEAVPAATPFREVWSDEALAPLLASAAGIAARPWAMDWSASGAGGRLGMWNGLRAALQQGDLAAWREAVQQFESQVAAPLWQALARRELNTLQLDVPGGAGGLRLTLTAGDRWRVWRRRCTLDRVAV